PARRLIRMADERLRIDVAPERLIGERIAGRFVVERLIGRGELSTAFRAHDDRLHRRVTVKLFHPRHRDDVQVVESQLATAHAVARLSHEHIAMLIDRGEHEGMPLVVLEYVRGENLQERIDRFAPLAVAEVVVYGLQIARALAYAHGHGVVHGNLRPGNVLLTEEREVKLVDFGGGSYVAQLVGDPYAAPELAEVDADAPSEPGDDVYALGALLFIALTEQAPRPGFDPAELQLLRPDMSPRLASIVARALAAHPDDRYMSMRELAAELAGVREAGSPADQATGALRTGARHTGQPTQSFSMDEMSDAEQASTQVGMQTVAGADGTRSGGGRSARRRARRDARTPLTPRETRARILAWSIVVAPLVALIIFGVMIAGERGSDQVDGKPAAGAGPTTDAKIVNIVTYDPPPGDGSEHPELADNILDDDLATTWATDGYDTRNFNGTKEGVGLVLQLDKPSEVRDVELRVPLTGWIVDVRVADRVEPEIGGWKRVSAATPVFDGVQIPVNLKGEKTEFVLLWITQLSIDTEDPNRSRARLSEVRVIVSE
ncbi:MAG: serine/threonine-protein kinase, partial [Gaiellales bacterium]